MKVTLTITDENGNVLGTMDHEVNTTTPGVAARNVIRWTYQELGHNPNLFS